MKFSCVVSGLKDQQIQEGFAKVIGLLNKTSRGCKLQSANRLYAQKDYELLQEFLAVVRDSYKSDLQSVDFKGNAEGVRGEINDWVAQMTSQKILNLIGPGVFDSLTRLVLVNAIYFKATWKKQFDEHETRKKAFYTGPNVKTEVRMTITEKLQSVTAFPSLDGLKPFVKRAAFFSLVWSLWSKIDHCSKFSGHFESEIKGAKIQS